MVQAGGGGSVELERGGGGQAGTRTKEAKKTKKKAAATAAAAAATPEATRATSTAIGAQSERAQAVELGEAAMPACHAMSCHMSCTFFLSVTNRIPTNWGWKRRG
mmetsp:Transcript_17282/g.47595  ORF Transcript_17282/g.47595 Transcript_17282/m.47595 type:complete len:105 (+) Transcript_17282:598-912(+)